MSEVHRITGSGPATAAGTRDSAPGASGLAQLLYTSFDNRASGNAGGWQVKQTVGELTPAERDALVARVSTTFDLAPRLPDFPSKAQIDERPARLSYLRTPEGAGAYWHSVDAGKDGSGRPGNVFTHALLKRGVPIHRPIEYWRSPGWLTPYGAKAVAAAALTGNAPPSPNPAVGAAAAISFLTGAFHRLTVFRAMMDAILDRLAGGPQVLLRTRDHEHSALWIAAVSHLLPPATAAGLSWSTHDSPRMAVTSRLDLVAIPAGSSVDKLPGKFLVVDEDGQPALAQTGGRHMLASGAQVPATVYSDLLEGALSDPDLALRIHDALNQIDADFPGQAVPPAWVLAAAMLREPDLSEFSPTAQQVIAEAYPATLNQVPWAADLVRKVQVLHPPTADAAHRRLQAAHERGAPIEVPAQQFAAALLTDDSWMSYPLERVRLSTPPNQKPPARVVDLAALRTGVQHAVARVRIAAEADPVGTLPLALRLAQILYALGLPGPAYDEATRELEDAMSLLSPALVWDLGAWPETTRIDQISRPILGQYVRPLLVPVETGRLARLSGETWVLLCRQTSGDLLLVPAPASEADRFTAVFAAVAILRDDLVKIPDLRRSIGATGVEAALDSNRLATAEARALIGDLLKLAPPSAEKLNEWFQRGSDRFDSSGLIVGLLTGPAHPTLINSLQAPEDGVDDDQVRDVSAAAWLRYWAAPQTPVPADATQLIRAVHRVSSAVDLAILPLVHELEPILHSALIVARTDGQTWAQRDTELGRRIDHDMQHRTGETATYLSDLLGAEALSPGWAAGLSFAAHVLAENAALSPSADTSTVDQAIDDLVRRGAYRGPRNATALRDAAWRQIRNCPAPEAEIFFKTYKKAAAEWFSKHRIEAGDSARWALGGK